MEDKIRRLLQRLYNEVIEVTLDGKLTKKTSAQEDR